jgi:hypothetical protein
MKPKVHILIIHYNGNLYMGGEIYRSKLLNHLKGFSKMNVMLGLGTVKILTKELQNSCTCVNFGFTKIESLHHTFTHRL